MPTKIIGDGNAEVNILTGDITVMNPVLSLNSRTTIRLEGLGEALTGLYYVNQVETSIGVNETTQTIKVQRNGFGDYTRAYDVGIKNNGKINRIDRLDPPNNARQHKVARGDTVYNIAQKYYGYAEYYRLILNANQHIKATDVLEVGSILLIP